MLKYFADLFKAIFNKRPPPVSWEDILDKEVVVTTKKRRKIMLPSNRVLVWKTDAEGKSSSKKKKTQTGVHIWFKFFYEDVPYVIKTQRPFEQNFTSEVLPKVTALTKKKVFKDEVDVSPNGLSVKLSPRFESLVSAECTADDFANDSRITSLLVNDSEFEIIRDPITVESATLSATPFVGQVCMPIIILNKSAPITLHWFLSEEKVKKATDQSQNDSKKTKKEDTEILKISYLDEDKREFGVNGYTFSHTGPYFIPDAKDVDRSVVVLADAGHDYPVYTATSWSPVTDALEEVVTDEQVNWCKTNKLDNDNDLIRVMCYNILADLYLNLNLAQEALFFNYCPKSYQRFFYRTPIFMKQISDFIEGQVSIFFLQEVDMSRYENFLKPFLKTVNYSVEITKKANQVSEGVALVFDQSRFQAVHTGTFIVSELVSSEESNEDVRRIMKTSEETEKRLTTRPTVLQIVILEDKKTDNIILCANTHLHHDPKEEHLKVLQALVCTRKVMEFYDERKRMEPKRKVSIIFGGDFNSTPGTAVFSLINTGFLSKSEDVWNCDEKVVPEDLRIEQKMECLSLIPEYTNYTADSVKKGFVGCLDYIWGLEASKVRDCPMPSHEKVIKYSALPSQISPSDHLPLISDIKL